MSCLLLWFSLAVLENIADNLDVIKMTRALDSYAYVISLYICSSICLFITHNISGSDQTLTTIRALNHSQNYTNWPKGGCFIICLAACSILISDFAVTF